MNVLSYIGIGLDIYMSQFPFIFLRLCFHIFIVTSITAALFAADSDLVINFHAT